MRDSAFDRIWQKVAAFEGAEFRTSKGASFTYRYGKTYIVVSTGNQSIPRTFFEKILRRLAEGTVESSPPLQGQVFILAILQDPRLG